MSFVYHGINFHVFLYLKTPSHILLSQKKKLIIVYLNFQYIAAIKCPILNPCLGNRCGKSDKCVPDFNACSYTCQPKGKKKLLYINIFNKRFSYPLKAHVSTGHKLPR